MLSVVISYKFKESLNTAGCTIPEAEAVIASFIDQNLYDSEMIEVTQFTDQGYPEYTEFPIPPSAVFIEIITDINLEIFDEYIYNTHAINDFIIQDFRRESIFLEDFWQHRDDHYSVVRLIKFTGQLPRILKD